MAPFTNLMRLGIQQPHYTPYHHNEHILPRQQAATGTISANIPTSSTVEGLSADGLIKQAENHWDVSATSILAAWVATMIGIVLILLLYSCVRLKWRRIYLPRLRLRKPGNTIEEKAEKKALEAKYKDDKVVLRKKLKDFEKKRYQEEPECYPGFIRDIDGRWKEIECDGKWVGKAPKVSIGSADLFGWMRSGWDETKIEMMSIIPTWLCCCWGFIGINHFSNGGKKGKQSTIFDQDVKIRCGDLLNVPSGIKIPFATISIFATILAFANYRINTETIYGSTNSLFTNLAINNSTNKSEKSKNSTNTNVIENPNLLTAANITSNGLLVHMCFEILVTMLVIIFVLKASNHHQKLVQEWERMNHNEISFKTLFITNLSMRNTIKETKKKIRNFVIGDISRDEECQVWFAVHPLNALEKRIEKFKKKQFSKAIKAVAMETFYESQGNENHLYDSCWDRIIGRSKNARTKVREAIDEKEAIERIQKNIREDEYASSPNQLGGTITAAFVSFPTAKRAKEVLMSRRVELSKAGYNLQKAPRTHNVLWRNLEQDAKSRASHKTFGKVALIFVCFLNTIPVMGIVLLTNIGIAIDRYPSLAKMQEESQFWKIIFMVIEGVLPATVAAIFSYFLPYIMRELNRWSGSITRGQLDKDQIRQVFIFLLVSNFIVFSLIGVLYETISGIYTKIGEESVENIYRSLGDLPAKITRAYISQSLYWFSWYPIRSIVMWLQLLQVPRLLMKTPQLLKFKTPQDLAEVTLAIHFEFALEYSFIIFAMCVGLIYAPLAPIVVIGATLHFWSAHIVHSQSLKYVNDAKETDGECWWVIINRLLIGTVFMQCLMVLTVTLKTQSPPMAVAAALPIFLIFIFKLYLNKHFNQNDLYHISANSNDYLEKKSDYLLEKYEPDVLRKDWMPTGRAISKSRRLRERAIKHVPDITQLVESWKTDNRVVHRKKLKSSKKRGGSS